MGAQPIRRLNTRTRRILAQYDAGGTLERYYVEGPSYVDEHVVLHEATGPAAGEFYYLHAALYSVTGVADAGGAPVVRYTYDAYGLPRAAVGSAPVGLYNSYLFTGRRLDFDIREASALGRESSALSYQPGAVVGTRSGRPVLVLYDYRARAYDPWHGRFCQRDPALYAESSNLYEYASSNPQSRVDPGGEFSYGDIMGAIRTAVNMYGMYDTVSTLKGAVAAFARGASLYNVMLGLAIEYAAGKAGGKVIDALVDVSAPALKNLARELGKGLRGASKIDIQLHHALPVFLGGKRGGILVGLDKELHEKYHAGLVQALRARGIYREAKDQKWEEYFEKNAAAAQEAWSVLMEYTRHFDLQHGTELWDAMWKQMAAQGFSWGP